MDFPKKQCLRGDSEQTNCKLILCDVLHVSGNRQDLLFVFILTGLLFSLTVSESCISVYLELIL